MTNRLILAVAGSGKTRTLAHHCRAAGGGRRILLVTFTQANQVELRARLRRLQAHRPTIETLGWYTFLIRHFARPFIPFKFPGRRVRGFNFHGRPNRYAKGAARFLDADAAVYACELGRLSNELLAASGGALLRRIEACYDEILVDEVQDLAAHDWEVMDTLLRSRLDVLLVGDIRQAVLSTNPRSSKNKTYAYADSIKWFRDREAEGILAIEEHSQSWRCRPEIAEFSDSIFDSSWGFPSTHARNVRQTGHDGVFGVRAQDVPAYVETFRPQCLRHGASSARGFEFDFRNFGEVKGLSFERVLIFPTKPISGFLAEQEYLPPLAAARFYVAVTRASQSVGVVMTSSTGVNLPVWSPP